MNRLGQAASGLARFPRARSQLEDESQLPSPGGPIRAGWTDNMPADKSTSSPGGEHEKIRTLGKYQIVRKLGAGGMGAVFLANDTELKRTVALKVLPKDRAENPTLVKRFKAEAQAVAQLKHENLVAIYETGEIQGFPYLALEYVDGKDLHTLIQKRGPIPPKRSLKIMRQVAEALQHAYEKNIVHRDIKPSNLLVQPDGTTKVTDFGLARSVDETLDTSITRAGTTVGTIDYISPEQACNSKAADVRSDIYSLGCTWYHMLTGEPPYPEGNLQNKLQGHMNGPIPNPRQINPNVPEAYVAVLHRMMEKRQHDRYQTPAELLADLNQVAGAVSSINAELFDEPAPAGADFDDDDFVADVSAEEHVAQKLPKSRLAKQKQQKPGRKGPGTGGTRDDSASRTSRKADQPTSKINEKWRGRGGPIRKPTATRGTAGADDLEGGEVVEEGAGGSEKKSKKLPPRGQKDPGGFAIDLDFARIGLIALIVVGAVGLFWWAFSRGSSWTSSSGDVIAGSTEPPPQPEGPEVINPNAPQAPNPDAPQAPPTRAVVARGSDGMSANEPRFVLADAELEVKREGAPFPGTDDLPEPDSKTMKELLPDWVYAVRNASTEGLSSLTVDTTPRRGSISTIAAAIQRQRDAERIVELRGPGPFTLDPTIVHGCDRLIIRAADGSSPLVVVPGDGGKDRTAGRLQLLGGVLELRGLHIVAESAAGDEPWTLLGVRGGTLHLRDCSVTVPDEAGPTVVARVTESGEHDYPTRVLIENCLLRGDQLTAASARGSQVDVVIGGSLLASRTGPLLTAESIPAEDRHTKKSEKKTDSGKDGPADESPKPPPAPKESLAVRVYGSVLWSDGEALTLRQEQGDAIRRGSVQLRRTICAAGGGDPATLVSLLEWPVRASSVSGQPKVAGLTWKQERTWLAGWPTLVRTPNEAATSEQDWAGYWGTPLETGALSANESESIPDPSRTGEAIVKRLSTLVPAEVSQGTQVGLVAVLPGPPQSTIDRHLLLAGRPRLPASFSNLPQAKEPIEIDLRALKRNLNDLLNSKETPDGAHLLLTGIGLVKVPPLHLKGKTLTLEFQQSGDGAPLTLRPDVGKGDIPEASIIVDGGRLNLIGARIQASPSRSREIPPQLVLIRDGQFTARYCFFEGSPAIDDPDRALVEWKQGERGDNRRYGYVADCQFAGTQPLVAADVDQRLLVVRNCLFAGRGDGVVLRSRVGSASVSRAQEGWIELEQNTFLCGGSALRMAGPSAGRTAPAVRVMASASAFAPAPGPTVATASVLRHPEGMTSANLFDWWGRRNGFAASLKRYRVSGDSPGPQPQVFRSDWQGFWGRDHVDTPHVGPNGVLTATLLTSINNLSPPDVKLAASCSGAAGAPDGAAIGIRPGQVGPLAKPMTKTSGGLTTPKPGTPATTPPKRTGIDF